MKGMLMRKYPGEQGKEGQVKLGFVAKIQLIKGRLMDAALNSRNGTKGEISK